MDALLESLYEERKNYDLGETEVLIVDSSKGEEKAAIMASCEKYDAQYIEGDDSVRKKRNKGIDLAGYEYILFIGFRCYGRAGAFEKPRGYTEGR